MSRAAEKQKEHLDRGRATTVLAGFVLLLGCPGILRSAQNASEALTFNKEIAPILYRHCSPCHRAGQAAPFPLLSYSDVKQHAKQIAEVTQKRFMPPWLPIKGHGDFADDPSLTDKQIAFIRQWLEAGAEEGPPPAPQLPKYADTWLLGQPDLVVKLPQPYVLAAEGKDVYRNVVIPIRLSTRKFVRGIEFLPGNWKVVHHVHIYVDPTPTSRRRAAKENPPGFDGMAMSQSAAMPGGQFLTWEPGKTSSFVPDGLAWSLPENSDLVLQMHLHPRGKPETVQPEIAFYFTDRAPTNSAIRINLNPLDIDIPPGTNDYVVEDKFVLPSDVDLLRLSPHAHYLCKRMEGYAVLPDGRRQDLLLITNWDFNWQNDYRYSNPIFLPKGTTLAMKYSYDNSAANVRNPFSPPRRVRYGPQTTDEMAELWLQVLPRNPAPAERSVLGRAIYEHMARLSIDHYERVLLESPKDAIAHTRAGTAEHYFGQSDRALAHFRSAVLADPNYDEAWYELGFLCLRQKRLDEAQTSFENVVRLNPDDYQAEGSLGSLYYQKGDYEKAEKHLKAALMINPGDTVARQNLALVQAARAKR